MNFWKKHAALRITLMLISFAAGLALLINGWRMTGLLSGLLIMLVGVAAFIVTLLLYNKPFE